MSTPSIELPVQDVLAATGGGERQLLEAMLAYYRAVIKRKAAGVSDTDLRRRLVPSQTTLGALLKHLTVVEQRWFLRGLAREPVPDRVDEQGRDYSWTLDPDDTITTLIAGYDAACERSRAIARGMGLDDTVPEPELGRMSLRWVYVHMIDETARHAGHADIIRELIDGSTGDF